jgi:tetratricopeptide (TPR) repeat protein
LIRAADGYHVWSETWDRKLDDIFKIQDEIAGKVVEELKVTLLGAAPVVRPADPKAYALILEAKALVDQGTAASRAQAIELYQQALAISPGEARAWSGLGRAYMNQVIFGERPASEAGRMAKEAQTKALELDPDDAVACSRLAGIAHRLDKDLTTAAKLYQRALSLEPTNLQVIANAATFLTYLGRLDEAIALDEYWASRDPANPQAHDVLGTIYFFDRRWDAAIASSRTALRLSPTIAFTHYLIGETLLVGKSDAPAAAQEISMEPGQVWRLMGSALILPAVGRRTEADAALAELVSKHADDQADAIASIYAYRGDADTAFGWLDRALKDPSALTDVLTDPLLASLHDDPRWVPLLRKLGKDPETLAKIEFKVTLPKEWQAETTVDTAAKPGVTAH